MTCPRAAIVLTLRSWLVCAACLPACNNPDPSLGGAASADASAPDAVTLADGLVVPALKLASVTPKQGDLAGGETLDIAGQGFLPTARVFVGAEEATVDWRAGTTHIYVKAPAAKQPGTVDVRVENGKTTKSTLNRAYAYLATVTVDGFAPEAGSMLGGSEITVRGSGFRAGDRVLVAYHEAAQTKFVDDKTLVALVPPYLEEPGAVKTDLAKVQVSVRHGSGVTHAKATFTYGRPPRADSVAPPVVGVDGGAVQVQGSGLGNATAVYANGAQGTLAPGTATSVRGAQVPALKAVDKGATPGPVELVLTSPYGNHKLFPAFAYVADAATHVALYGASPASGPTSGGNTVTLMAAIPEGTAISAVTIGGKPAPHKVKGSSIEVTAPSGSAGAAAIEIATTSGSASLPAGYLYIADLKVDVVEPGLGPTAGGGEAQVRGKGLHTACTVRIGMYSAKVLSGNAKGTALQVVVPPGAPGAADVVVRCGGLEVTLPGGYGYVDGHARINAVSPPSGSTGGGATVKVHGSGLRPGVKVFFGGKPTLGLTFVHSGLCEAKIPPHPAGLVAVDLIDGDLFDTLVNGFNYYAPGTPEGGTWGEGVGGTLNVTVLNIYTRAPIEDAVVQLGSPGEAIYHKYTGVTDAKGMVVFSGSDVVPPIRVSATKPEFTASSIIHFDASNATLLLFPYTPPSSGQGNGNAAASSSALLKGKVVDIDKYLLIPPANCLGSTDAGDLTCKSCAQPVDCTGTTSDGTNFHCVNNGPAGQRCLPSCADSNSCKSGFVCVPDEVAPGAKVCKPTIGIRKVYCATTVRDIDADEQNPIPSTVGNGGALPYPTAPVDEKTGEFEITSRLDELAVVCIGGYISNATKKFVPSAMGVRRHVFPKPYIDKPKDAITGLEVRLTIPLKRELQVRLDHPQPYYGGMGGQLALKAWLDLGSDGLVRLPSLVNPGNLGGGTTVVDDVPLPYQPVMLPAGMTDATYTYYAHALYGQSEEIGPVSLTIHEGLVQPGDANLRVRKPDGTSVEDALGVHQTLTGVVAGPDGKVLILGRNGGLWRGPVQAPQLLWLPPVVDPYATPAAALALAGTPTDATVVGAGGMVRRVAGNKVSNEASGTKADLLGVCHGEGARVAVGDAATLLVDEDGSWQPRPLPVLGKAGLRAVACAPDLAVAVGDDGWVVAVDLAAGGAAKATKIAPVALHAVAWRAGTFYVAGDKPAGDGPVLVSGSGKGLWLNAWPAGTVTPTFRPLRAVVPLADGALILADREGHVVRADAKGTTDESSERLDLRPRAGAVLPDGAAVLVGEPGLWLGPFLTVPTIDKPLPNTGLSGSVPVEWSVAPGPTPSFSRVHLDGNLDPKSGWGFPFWWIYVGPEITNFLLPDFEEKGIQVFIDNPKIQYWVRVDRGFVPGFSINGFSTLDLEFGRWRSRATNTVKLGSK
ncbi:MAG: IPT/TIG domain-containing protein [Deltaproteobacteria bacterium]|nr:IPT/TIG domain-containing protein [Deltaproteobacteria bacterium]